MVWCNIVLLYQPAKMEADLIKWEADKDSRLFLWTVLKIEGGYPGINSKVGTIRNIRTVGSRRNQYQDKHALF